MGPRVLLVEDGASAEALAAALGQQGLEVTAVSSMDTALVEVGAAPTEAVLWVRNGQGLAGPEAVRALRERTPVPVMLVARSSGPGERAAALDAGADDVVDEPADPVEVRARLEAALRRDRRPASAPVAPISADGLELDVSARWVAVDGAEVRLTPTEWRLLETLVRGAGRLLTYEEIIAQVWTPRHGDEARASLRAHLRSLRRKLGDDPTAPQYVATEPGQGCRWLLTA